MKRGFTLIELLAVIVILAIIALIATPIVLNIINDAKESSLVRSAEFYLNGVEISVSTAKLNNKNVKEGTYSIMEDGNICLEEYDLNTRTCKDNDGNPNNNELIVEVKGEKPNSGKVSVNEEGKVAMSLYNDTYYTMKDYDDSNVDVYEIIYYSKLREAVNDVNNNEIGTNADGAKETAEAGVYINDKNEVSVVLLKSVTLYPNEEIATEIDKSGRLTLSADMTLNLNGNVLTFENTLAGIDAKKGNTSTITIDGRLNGSTIVLNGSESKSRIIQTRTSNFIIKNGNYILNNDSYVYDSMTGIVISSGSSTIIENSNIRACANNLSQSNQGVCDGIDVYGTLTIRNSEVMGRYAGIANSGILYVDGGTYEGNVSCGIYFSDTDSKSENTIAYVENAIIREYDASNGFTAYTGLYIGGNKDANNIMVYINNSEIYGSAQPIMFRGIGGEHNNILSISNSKIHGGKIVIDGGNHTLNIGTGNNFTEANVELTNIQSDKPSSVNSTNETYTRENIEK